VTASSKPAVAFPAGAVRGRLEKSLPLAPAATVGGYPLAVAGVAQGLLVAWPQAVGLYDPRDGREIALWPPRPDPARAFAAPPVFHSGGPVVVDPVGPRIVWLYAATLAERASLDLSTLELAGLRSEGRRVSAFTVIENGDVFAVVTGPTNGKFHTVLALFAPDGRHESSDWLSIEPPRSIVYLESGIYVALQNAVLRFPVEALEDETVVRAELDDVVDRLWPSPDGRFLIATGDGSRQIHLFRLDPAGEPPMQRVLAGAYAPKTEQSPEGWRFWNLDTPPIPDPAPLLHPAVAWDETSRFAVVGDQNGVAALIEPNAPTAAKIMLEAGIAFFPWDTSPPNGIQIVNRTNAARLLLDWDFEASLALAAEAEASEARPAKQENIPATEPPGATRPLWFYAALALIGAAAAYVGVWLLSR